MASAVRLILAVVFFVGVDSYCMNGWTRFEGSCYLFVDLARKTWMQADQACTSVDAHLVQIDSLNENNFLKKEIRMLNPGTEDQFWTAGNDLGKEGMWVWGHTNDTIQKTYWHPGEPNQNAGEEDCLTFYTRYLFDWNDEHCDRDMFYICEIEYDPGPVSQAN